MRPISFSGMEDAITVQKPNGTHVNYHIFEESEIHLNRITPGSVQEWHYHTLIDECLLITKGVLTCRWMGRRGRGRSVSRSLSVWEARFTPLPMRRRRMWNLWCSGLFLTAGIKGRP